MAADLCRGSWDWIDKDWGRLRAESIKIPSINQSINQSINRVFGSQKMEKKKQKKTKKKTVGRLHLL
jgi:hypothetical protein